MPSFYRKMVLNLTHDHTGGYLGKKKKTTDTVLLYFHGLGINSDVSEYCKSCHIRQIAGKINSYSPNTNETSPRSV